MEDYLPIQRAMKAKHGYRCADREMQRDIVSGCCFAMTRAATMYSISRAVPGSKESHFVSGTAAPFSIAFDTAQGCG